MDTTSRIYVAGHRGLAGSAICRKLASDGYKNVIVRTRAELDLRQADSVDRFFEQERPEYVFLAAAKVGGILANATRPAEFLRDNVLIQTNVIDAAYRYGAKKLEFLGSSCIYPKLAPQPLREEYLLTGPLEPTNEAYAVAKIAGIQMARAYREQYGFASISLMPTNLYGPGDNFDLNSSHVLPALLRKFHEARRDNLAEVTVWGSGAPWREFLHVDDLADAAVFLMRTYDAPEIINVGTGQEIRIRDLVELIRGVTGFTGRVAWDASKPDGTPRKLLDVSKLHAAGWKARTSLPAGVAATYKWYLTQ